MPFDLPFGLSIGKSPKAKQEEKAKESFILQDEADGSITIERGAGFFTTTYLDLEGQGRSDYESIITYRELSLNPEIESAIDDISNEAIVADERKPIVQLNLDEVKLPGANDGQAIKDKILDEFHLVYRLLRFQTKGHELFRKWYVDSKLYFHVLTDADNPGKGILEVRDIDPLTIRKIREVERKRDEKTGMEIPEVVDEYYVYNEQGFQGGYGANTSSQPIAQGPASSVVQGTRISLDAIT
ncbi:unnamed protein product, partial [marine sediment metagenome]